MILFKRPINIRLLVLNANEIRGTMPLSSTHPLALISMSMSEQETTTSYSPVNNTSLGESTLPQGWYKHGKVLHPYGPNQNHYHSVGSGNQQVHGNIVGLTTI